MTQIARTFENLSKASGLLSLALLASCSQMKSNGESGSQAAVEQIHMSSVDVNRYPVNKLVCDPMESGDPDPRSNYGIKAELFYLPKGSPTANKISDVITNGQKSAADLFFSQLNVPTRAFDKGFVKDDGATLKNDAGETLMENFALRFKTILRLAPEQTEGEYEIAVLSDDGSVLKVRDEAGVYTPYVDNDGVHQTRLGCAAEGKYIQFNRDTEKLVELTYHQGPRYHIALIVLMRKKTSSAKSDPACGLTGNDTWFTAASAPKLAYNELLGRGWAPLTKDNYALANDAVFNPCKEGATPTITNFGVSETTSDGFFLVWKTDIPATDQVIATDLVTGEQTVTVSDNVLRVNHAIWVRGLKKNYRYGLQAVSISDSYGKGMTTAIYAQTLQ